MQDGDDEDGAGAVATREKGSDDEDEEDVPAFEIDEALFYKDIGLDTNALDDDVAVPRAYYCVPYEYFLALSLFNRRRTWSVSERWSHQCRLIRRRRFAQRRRRR